MGNNPFAGCPHLKLKNQSPFFVYENGILYNREKDSIIYCSIMGNETDKNPRGSQNYREARILSLRQI